MTIVAVTGLQREARIVAAPGIRVVIGGGDATRLAAELDRAMEGARGVVSIGIAGALGPGWRPGDWAVARAVLDGGEAFPADPAWAARLLSGLPGARAALFLGSDAMVAEAAAKAALHRDTGAEAVDMESHVAARVARRHGLPFVAARVISDAADRTLPPAARVGMRPDGGMDLGAVLRSLLSDPRQIPALIRTGWEAERGFRALLRGHHRLGPGLAAP
ncbi:hopanoid-associated phosphorylase [Muricoccus radiodurans]|uniref:phosphorylase family protein n=1 Tax=Muricoccus radiodurans TaxID=2231721 RepID=UPI003CEF43C7